MAPSKCAAHGRGAPCGACTSQLWSLLEKRVPGTRLWQCDLEGLSHVLQRGTPDLTACLCGRGSTLVDRAERCACKGGKMTPLRAAEERATEGAAWQNEDVTVNGRRLRGDDLTWQRGAPHGASKESLIVLNLIKAQSANMLAQMKAATLLDERARFAPQRHRLK